MRKNQGMTLIEVLIGATVLVTFLLPVFGLMSLGNRSNEYTESWQTGLEIAENVMQRLISEDVPFLAIDEEGFGGGTPAVNGRAQADFLDSRGSLNFGSYNLQAILGGDSGGYKTDSDGDRIITRKGVDYKILFFAGIYKEDGANALGGDPDDSSSPSGGNMTVKLKKSAFANRELTFSFYPNPWFDAQNDCSRNESAGLSGLGADSSGCAVTGRRPINPYKQLSGFTAGQYFTNDVADPMLPNFRPGFPAPLTGAFNAGHSGGNDRATENNMDEVFQEAPLPGPYNPRYEDKPTHNFTDEDGDGKDDGAFMKLVVGVRWSPRGWGGAGAARRDQEFYLVSFKANLAKQ